MADIFVTKIEIEKVRHLENLTIDLSETERKHLILTGKNGSGKTSVLEAMHEEMCLSLTIVPVANPPYYEAVTMPNTGISVVINNDLSLTDFFYFPSDHKLRIKKPTAIEKVELKTSDDIVKYMVYLDYVQLKAEKDGNQKEKLRIENWFTSLRKILQNIFESPDLEIKSIAEDLNFKIKIQNKEMFGFDEMSDGYSAALRIILDLVASMKKKNNNFIYDMPGIVLIDEIETHLHVEMQKKVLPFLTTMFPNIQFIVTTHSPFVLSSIENAVICDLEKRTISENFSAYSYEGIVEYYFNAEKYSEAAKANFNEYKALVEKTERTESENERLSDLITYFRQTPTLGSPEIMNAFFASELVRRSCENG